MFHHHQMDIEMEIHHPDTRMGHHLYNNKMYNRDPVQMAERSVLRARILRPNVKGVQGLEHELPVAGREHDPPTECQRVEGREQQSSVRTPGGKQGAGSSVQTSEGGVQDTTLFGD